MDSVFGIGFPELITVLILAGIVMGPERIGRVARWLGKITAQLQSISRAFARQLVSELEGVDGDGDLRGAMQEIQDLQRQLTDLRQEIRGQSNNVLSQGKNALADVENQMLPPERQQSSAAQPQDAPPDNHGNGIQPPSFTELPKPLDIADDPE